MEQGTAAQPVAAPTCHEESGSSVTPAMKKSAWSKDEDAMLREQVRLHGAGNWPGISAALPGRTSRSCRLRWCQHLDPGIETARPFTAEEDALVVHYQRQFPNKWSTIAAYLPGRSDNAVKNRWNSVLGNRQGADQPSLDDRTLKLFRLRRGDVRMSRGEWPVLGYLPPVEDDGVVGDQSGACLELFPLKLGDLVRTNANGVAPMSVDYGVGDPLIELRLWPSPTMAA